MTPPHLTNFHIRIGLISVFILSLCMMMSCSSLKQHSSPQFSEEVTSEERMVVIAIEDFMKNRRLAKQDSIFGVRYRDSVYHGMIWNDTIRQWEKGPLYQGVKCVSIIGENDTRFPPDWEKAFPHHYYLKGGKLFLWYGGKEKATQEVIDILYQWKIIDPSINWMEFTQDDAKKGVCYFFKSDGSYKYKKIITNKAGIEPPKGL